MNENLFEVLRAFRLDAKPVSCEPYGCGHINVTYLAVTESGRRYILQKINNNTFRDVAGLMENITAVTEFLRTKPDDPRSVLTLVKTHDGASYLHAQDAYWRVYDFVEDSICLQLPETDEDFYQSAVGFGTFQQLLTDFPAAKRRKPLSASRDRTVKSVVGAIGWVLSRIAAICARFAGVSQAQTACMTASSASGSVRMRSVMVYHSSTFVVYLHSTSVE